MERRSFLKGVFGLIAAPAIVKSEILMPVKKIIMPDGIALKTITHPHLSLAEAAEITRKAFIPKLIAQQYQQSPSWQELIASIEETQKVMAERMLENLLHDRPSVNDPWTHLHDASAPKDVSYYITNPEKITYGALVDDLTKVVS